MNLVYIESVWKEVQTPKMLSNPDCKVITFVNV